MARTKETPRSSTGPSTRSRSRFSPGPSTRSQTRKVLRLDTKPKRATSRRAKAAPLQTTRVLRSTTTPSSTTHDPSQAPPPHIPRKPLRRRTRTDPWLPKRKPPKTTRKPRAPPRTHRTCRVCAEEQPVADFIPYVSPRSYRYRAPEVPYACISHLAQNPYAKHIDPVCKSCIGASMAARLDLLGARRVSFGCLEPGCNAFWDFDFVMKYFPAGEALEKYNEGMLRVWLEDAKMITCINSSCAAQGLPDPRSPGYPHVQCHACSTRMCASCNVPWHTDLTCSEYAARHVNAQMTDPEKDTLKIMQEKDGKRCPNCFIVIEKDGGCDSVYCMGCRTYFDWSTAARAVPGRKKVVPTEHLPIWEREVVCEADALAIKEKQLAEGVEGAPPVVAAA